MVGGEPAQVDAARARAREPGAADVMVFTGQQPASEIPGFVQACDLLVSPRIRGTNTPLKIYSYLRSGKPIVATNLLTHTQVLTPEIAALVDAGAGAVCGGDARRCSTTPTSARGAGRPRARPWRTRSTAASRICAARRRPTRAWRTGSRRTGVRVDSPWPSR